jgi:mannose-6-phosphate isomerase
MISSRSRIQPAPRPALFLDRDGIVNIDRGYIHDPDLIELTPTAAEGIRLANERGCWVIVATNQSGVARGLYGLDAVRNCHRRIDEILISQSARIDAYYVSPYHRDGTVPAFSIDHPDRKPGPGMLFRAMRDFPIDRDGSILFGDKQTDIDAAVSAGLSAKLLPRDSCDLAAAVGPWLAGLSSDASKPSPLKTVRDWTREVCLPYWADRGYDLSRDRFWERLDRHGRPVIVPHRSMVQARQIAVYAKATAMGWIAGGEIAERAMMALQRDFAEIAGGMASYAFSIDPLSGRPLQTSRDAYGHAFILFAIANLHALTGDRELLNLADRTIRFIDHHLIDPVHGGMFSTAGLPDAEKLQNPQMHLLEAYLMLAEASQNDAYLDRARGMVSLFQSRLFDSTDRILPERRDTDWSYPTGARPTFEPGHHYEWMWLLTEFGRLSGTDMTQWQDALAQRAHRDGHASSGLVLDEVALDGTIVGSGHRIWQQTEAIRTCLARDPRQRATAERIAMLLSRHFLDRPFQGGWIDHLAEDLAPKVDYVPASTLYHLVTAACQIAPF